jgi:enoyl-CoA hydratase/carnithine racemase
MASDRNNAKQKRISAFNRPANDQIHTRSIAPLPAAALRRSAGQHFADLPGIVTCCLLLFKCRQPSRCRDLQMPTPAHASSHPDDPARLRIEGPVAIITLNRPAAFNSIDLSIAKKLEQLGAEVEANETIRVLVIEGEGRAFSAGGDLQTIGAAAEADTIAPVVGELLKHYHAFIETIRRMPKIVLSSVHGSAAGAGMGLAFVADLCIAADTARFTPAYAKIGVSPDGGSTVGMVGTVGTRRALQIFLAEDSFTASQAYEWGLVAKVVPAAELKSATRQFAERLAQNPASAIAGTKSLVYQAAVTPVRQQLDAEEANIIAAMQTEEFRIAVKKFTSKAK